MPPAFPADIFSRPRTSGTKVAATSHLCFLGYPHKIVNGQRVFFGMGFEPVKDGRLKVSTFTRPTELIIGISIVGCHSATRTARLSDSLGPVRRLNH